MRRLASRLLLSLVSLAAAALLLEGIWRFVRSPAWGPTTNPALVVPDDRLGWRYRPGARARHRTDEFDVAVRIDASGFRGPETPLERASGRRRIVALGDSFTFGWGVEAEAAWPARLASILDVEVVNLGVSGYGTDQEYLLLSLEGLRRRPDLVLVHVAPNDVEEVMRDAMYGMRKPSFSLEEAVGDSDARLALVPRGGALRPPLLERLSLFYRSARRAWRERTREPLDARERERGRLLVRRLLRAMESEAEASGAAFCAVAERETLEGDGSSLDPRPPGWTVDLSIPLDEAGAAGEPIRFLRDGHWNARGHRVVAEAIAAALRERGFPR